MPNTINLHLFTNSFTPSTNPMPGLLHWSPSISLGLFRDSALTKSFTPSIDHVQDLHHCSSSLAISLGLCFCQVSAFTHSCVCSKMSVLPCVQHLVFSQCNTKPFLALLSITFFFSQACQSLVICFTCKFPYCGVQYLTQLRSHFWQTSTPCQIAPSIP